ncbi:MAG: GNAT family acetyltransferase [Anaerolineales bacterium]|nr:GNAT family acetyltransferase [Anaerolineales bacterium]MDW8227507.1 GNAT family acetyltransferase [Anaerolineales bacterium]
MSVIHIREFRFPEDWEAVIHLWRNAGPGVQVRRSDTPQEIQKKLQRDPDLFLVAEQEGQIVGTVMGGFDGRRGLIYHLAVTESMRNRGIGSLLMDEVENRLRRKGCLRCYLLVTRENETAIRFYEKRGWQRMEFVYVYGKDLI